MNMKLYRSGIKLSNTYNNLRIAQTNKETK